MDGYEAYPSLELDRPAPHVLRLTLRAEGRLNAVSGTMHRELAAIWKTIADDDDTRVVLVRGADGAFSSGGALADGRGRVVGINTAVAGIGLGLAVPINAATRQIVGALMQEGRFRRAYLGIGGQQRPLPPRLARELGRAGCIEVGEIVEDAPAARAGVRPGDLIVAVDNQPVETMAELQRLLVGERIGSRVTFTVARHERVLDIVVVPHELAA